MTTKLDQLVELWETEAHGADQSVSGNSVAHHVELIAALLEAAPHLLAIARWQTTPLRERYPGTDAELDAIDAARAALLEPVE